MGVECMCVDGCGGACGGGCGIHVQVQYVPVEL